MNFHPYLFHTRAFLLHFGVRNGIRYSLVFPALVSVKLMLEEEVLFAVFHYSEIFTIL